MKKFLCILVLMGIVSIASAQVANYTFSQATYTYTELTGGNVVGSATTDDQYFIDSTVTAGGTATTGIGLPIGFNFTYNGNNFDVFGVQANGWISLGQSSQTPSVNMNTSSNSAPISATSTAPAALQNRVVGFGRNLIAQTVSELRYETIGTVPNRTLVVQWKNYKRTTGGAIDTLNFQIRLNETSNVVEVVYGIMKVSSTSSTIQVGLRGETNADYNNRTTTTDWTATTAGIANNSTMTISTTVFPASGLTYIWTPPLADDAGVTAINSPTSPIPSGLQDIAVTIMNFGADTLFNTLISWSINGILQTPFPWSDTLTNGSTDGPDTIGTYNFTMAGNNVIKAWTEDPNGNTDLNNPNDTSTINITVLPAKELAAVAWLWPVSGCGLSATDSVVVQFTNVGTAAQTNIPVGFSIDGGTTVVGPEIIAGPVNPGDTITYKFTATADFSAPGVYNCIFAVKKPGDANPANDSAFATVVSIGVINTFPFTENFDNTQNFYFNISAAANAGANFLDTNGVGNSGCAFFTGYDNNTGWPGTGTIPAAAAYGTYTSHHSTLTPCSVDATTLSDLRMKFDLRQEYYTQKTYTWLVVIANGTDTLTDIDGFKYYNPTTTASDPFTTRTFDLSTYAGSIFTIEFKSACKYNTNAGAPGNNNYIDNVMLYEPVAIDAGVISVLSPISAACGNATDSLIVVVKNYGLDTLTNIPVIGDITAPSGGHLILTDTLDGPLAPDATDTLLVGFGNTVPQGTYNVAAYTDLAADNVFTNDTAHYSFTKYIALTIPHLEDFESVTPLEYWTTNFLSGNGHGNTSNVMYKNISFSATTGSALMNIRRTGNLSSLSYLTFDYRIVNSPAGTTGTTLTTDSVFVLISNDCETTYDTIFVINAGNHVTSASMKHIVLPVASYSGTKVMPGFFVKRGTAGNYFLDIDNVAISNAAVVNLGTDTAFCPGENITLNAGGSPTGYTYSYNWSTLAHPASIATTQIITIDSATTYIAAVDNGYGVITNDTVIVGYHTVPIVSLGNDTSNCVAYTLDPGPGYSSYSWSTSATTQSIPVTSTGTYWVDVTNSDGCTARDSINVTIIPIPTVDAGTAQSICYIDTLQIVSATAADYDSLLWTSSGDGHFNDSTLLNPYYVPGTTDIANGAVDLTLTAYANCDTVSSLVVVTITTSTVAYAGADEEICLGDNVQLSAIGGTTYAWSPSTGLSNTNIPNPIASPTSTTTYIVTVTSSCGTATDNVIVTVDVIAILNLGADQAVCADVTVILDAGSVYNSYNWSTGETTQTISVDTAGIGTGTFDYWVDVTSGVCSASDTVSVTFDPCVGFYEYSGVASINIYPNPTTGMIDIVSSGIPDAMLNIFNTQGAVIRSEFLNSNVTSFCKHLNLSYLPKGIYLIRVSNAKESMMNKLIIQ